MKASAFAPGHITGFFEISEHPDILQTGSRGCGVVINKGVYTTVDINEAEENKIRTYINGEKYNCPVTRTVVEEVLKLTNAKYRVEIFHELEIPISYGFGTSASGALGTVLGMNKALNLNITLNQCGRIAHKAEVVNKTGLGDVIAECYGGLVIREKPGAPGIGVIDKIPCGHYLIAFIVGSALETKAVLTDEEKRQRINAVGRECLDIFFKNPSTENFLHLSKKFALETKLMDEKVHSVVKQLENNGVEASMIMLGNSVFTLTDEPERVCDLVEHISIIAEIDNTGARVI